MSAGHSGRSLVQKLGISQGQRVAFLGAPEHYEVLLGELANGATIARFGDGMLDLIHFFATSKENLEKEFPKLKSHVSPNGMIWISWKKKGSSRSQSDLDDASVREVGLKNGLVDVKVCAVDKTWSALKFVHRSVDGGPKVRTSANRA